MENSQEADSSVSGRPPVLSFRAFHATHFSGYQRQAFFSGFSSGPFHPSWPQSEPAWSHGEWSVPEGADLEPCSYEEAMDHPEDHQVVELTRTTEECDHVNNQEQHEGVLSKETIAIFEFSRRFRQEKASAELKEKSRQRLRRTKRRKLTNLGFALNEGNSDESESDLSHERSYLGKDEEEDDEDGDEDDDDIPAGELPATDISFMSLNEKLRERTHHRLYASSPDRADTSEIRSIEMLEDLLNQTYNDSVRQDGVVYWPGMPLRC